VPHDKKSCCIKPTPDSLCFYLLMWIKSIGAFPGSDNGVLEYSFGTDFCKKTT